MNPFAGTLEIKPGTSHLVCVVLMFISLPALIVIFFSELPLLIRVILSCSVLIWLAMAVREHGYHQGKAITCAILRSDNTWRITLGNADPVSAELLPGCLVQPRLTVLQFSLPERRRKTLILSPDNVDANDFRRLRVRLMAKCI